MADIYSGLESDLMLEIARGKIHGMSHMCKFGRNRNLTADTKEDVWDGGGIYSYPATALMTHVSQTADQATMRGGTVEVQGLDANWEIVTQTVILDGTLTTTAVALTTPLLRAFRMKVTVDITTTSPIRLHNAGETTDYAIVDTGNGQTLMAMYTVPAGKTAYMVEYYATAVKTATRSPNSTEVVLWCADRANNYPFQVKHAQSVADVGGGIGHSFGPYHVITEKTDIKIQAEAMDAAGWVSAGFNVILIDN